MKSFMSICLDKNSKTPIYKQLGDALLNLISEGVLEPDQKLPPIRKMAECLKINSSTVVNTYKYLETKHAVYSFMGSGTFVAPINDKKEGSIPVKSPPDNIVAETVIKADLSSEMPDDSAFPASEIKHAFNSYIEKNGGKMFGAASRMSLAPLAETVAARLGYDSITTDKNRLFFLSSQEDAIAFAARSVVNKGDYVVLEKPCAYHNAGIYSERGAKVLQAPLCKEGINLEVFEALLKTFRPKAAHLSTCLQSPTGVRYSLQNKKNILELCYKYGVTIIEEDIYGELLLESKKSFIKSLDYKSGVVYIKSLTKACLPWFNICVCLLPGKYARIIENTEVTALPPDNAVQIRILNELYITGEYEKVRKKAVESAKAMYERTAEMIDSSIGEFIEYDRNVLFMGFWLKLKNGSATIIAQKCAKRGVLIVPGSVYFGGSDSFIRICGNHIETSRLMYGLSVLKDELTKQSFK